MPGVSGDRGPRRDPSPARAGRRPAGLPRLWGPPAPVGPRPGAAGPPRQSWVRPRRACCAGCGASHVLLAATSLPRRADRVEVVGAALLAAAGGRGHRPIAAALGVPPDTVRGWLRRARERAGWLRALAMRRAFEADPTLGPVTPRRLRLADAVEALGLAVAALTRRLGVLAASPWQVIAALTGGRLLAPLRSG
jgi:transposase-like protein